MPKRLMEAEEDKEGDSPPFWIHKSFRITIQTSNCAMYLPDTLQYPVFLLCTLTISLYTTLNKQTNTIIWDPCPGLFMHNLL